MWLKSKLTKIFLLSLVLSSFCVLHVFSQEGSADTSQLKEEQMTYSNSSQQSQTNLKTSNENIMIESLNVNDLNNSSIQLEMKSKSASELLDNLDLIIMTWQSQLEMQSSLLPNLENELKNTKLELENSKKTCQELRKSLESNLNDIDTILAEIAEAYEMVDKLKEQISSLSRIKNRIRITSYVELGIGVPTLVLGCLPIWKEDQKNIQNLLLGIGGSLTAAGGVGFIFTFNF